MTKLHFNRNSKKKRIYKKKSTKTNIKYGGNPPRRLPNVFRIYTTGIADDGREDDLCYRNIWNRFVREEILRFIPQNFTDIEILHFDTFEGATIPKFSEERKNELERTLRENLTNGDVNDRSRRVSLSEFNRLPVNLEYDYPFLIIDFAGIIRIINSQMNELRDQYIRIQFRINGIQYDGTPFYAPFLYFGYHNLEQSYFELARTQRIPLLSISEDGNTITTYEGYYADRGLYVEGPDVVPVIINKCKIIIKERLNFVNRFLTEPDKHNQLNKIAKILSATRFIRNVLEQSENIENIENFPSFIELICELCIDIINENIETKDLAFFDNYRL